MDKIFIKGLLIRAVIGVHDWERSIKQDIVVNAELFTDTRNAGSTDQLADSVDYNSVCNRIISLIESSQPYLIEQLINHIAKTIIKEFSLEKVRLTVEKPGALRFADSVGITIERLASEYA